MLKLARAIRKGFLTEVGLKMPSEELVEFREVERQGKVFLNH